MTNTDRHRDASLHPPTEPKTAEPVAFTTTLEKLHKKLKPYRYQGCAKGIVQDALAIIEHDLSAPAAPSVNTYAHCLGGKWVAGFNIENQSFTLNANDGTEEEAKWYCEMMNKAFSKLGPPSAKSKATGEQQERKGDGWISVKDRLPDAYDWVLVYADTEETLDFPFDIGRLISGEWKCLGWDYPVTHWMPLPEPPTT